MQNEIVERFAPGRPSSQTNGGGALKEFCEISAVSRELLFYNSRLDGLIRCVELIGKKTFEHFEDRDDRLIYHSVTLDPTLSSTHRGGQKPTDTYSVESMGEVSIRKMTQKFSRNPDVPPEEDFYKICYFLAEGKIRVDYHREPGKITYKSVTYQNEDGNLVILPKSPNNVPTQAEVQKLLAKQANCKEDFKDRYLKMQYELNLRRKEENSIRARRDLSVKRRDLSVPGSREDVLEPSVYDLARESARVDALREGAEEEKQEETTSKVDILAPYLVDFINKDTGFVQLDSLQAELVAKKCTQDFRRRLTDRAEIIQSRLEEEHDQLRKRRAQMQRRGDNVEKDERDFERYQSEAMFRTQILEQRLARHEMQAIEKFQQLEKMLQEDPRLAAMWQKEPAIHGADKK